MNKNVYRLSIRLNLDDSRDRKVYEVLIAQPNMNRFVIESILTAQSNKEILDAINLLHEDIKEIEKNIEDSSSEFKQLTI